MTTPETIVIVDGARTPVGSFGGVLKDVPAHELGAHAATAALERSRVPGELIEEVVMGCIGQVGPDAYLARRVALQAGLPQSTPAFTVNRLCGSGLQSIWSAAMQMRWNGLRYALAGGAESMSRMPFYDFDGRRGHRMGDRRLVDGTVMMLTDPFSQVHMGVTAEHVARSFNISRDQQDEFAVESQRRAAQDSARAFEDEIVPLTIGGRQRREIAIDEHPNPATTADGLAGLRPAFEAGGTVTAGNSSGINDGAAAVVLTTASEAAERGLSPLASLEAVSTAGLDPQMMGYAPVPALKDLFDRTGLSPADVDVDECNEAFAAQACAVIRDAGLDPERTNPYGGAVALGHPVGATGTILTLRAAKHLVRHDAELAVVTMCIGGGQALAALLRRV